MNNVSAALLRQKSKATRVGETSEIAKYRNDLIVRIKEDYLKMTKTLRIGGVLKTKNVRSAENRPRKKITQTQVLLIIHCLSSLSFMSSKNMIFIFVGI